jgi:hypothetical protein
MILGFRQKMKRCSSVRYVQSFPWKLHFKHLANDPFHPSLHALTLVLATLRAVSDRSRTVSFVNLSYRKPSTSVASPPRLVVAKSCSQNEVQRCFEMGHIPAQRIRCLGLYIHSQWLFESISVLRCIAAQAFSHKGPRQQYDFIL